MTQNYPNAPGYKTLKPETSQQAAQKISGKVATLRERCYNCVVLNGREGVTPDEAAEQLHEDKLSIRPRFTELARYGRIVDSGSRRKNRSGHNAAVWVVAYTPILKQVEFA